MRLLAPTAFAILLALCPLAGAATTFAVNDAGETPDAHPGDGVCDTGAGKCTLGAAMQEANALSGTDIIQLPAGTYVYTATLPGLGAFGPKLVKNVQTAKARKLDAEGSCRESNVKKVKKQLQQSAKALTQYAHRLNGLSARKKIASLRQRFLDEAAPIQNDLKTLRGAVRCPDDAPAG